jgi:hypothetical protein
MHHNLISDFQHHCWYIIYHYEQKTQYWLMRAWLVGSEYRNFQNTTLWTWSVDPARYITLRMYVHKPQTVRYYTSNECYYQAYIYLDHRRRCA